MFWIAGIRNALLFLQFRYFVCFKELNSYYLYFLLSYGHFSFNFNFLLGCEGDSSCPCGPAWPRLSLSSLHGALLRKIDVFAVSHRIQTGLWWSYWPAFTVLQGK
jgi:hypothetical protein